MDFLSCTGALIIPNIVLVIQLIIDTISNLTVYEIQLLQCHEFENTRLSVYSWDKWYVRVTMPIYYSQTGFDIVIKLVVL